MQTLYDPMGVTNENGNMSLSDTSENGGDEERTDDICRDYLRNVCKRGQRCKYRHPDNMEAKELGRRTEYTFCHDYQNSGCRRPNCKFIHCTREEEEYHKQTGQLPVRLQQAAALGIGVPPNELPLLKGEVPVCKDFLKGECKRSGRCKYRHINATQYDLEKTRKNGRTVTANTVDVLDSFKSDDFERFDYETATKRRRTEDTFSSFTNNYFPDSYRSLLTGVDYRLLEDENSLLRRKMDELKKQVSDLAATNEVLLDQNARFRSPINKPNVVAPVVTVSQVVTPTITHAATVARPTMIAPSLSCMTAPLSVDGGATELVARPSMQSQLASELAQQASIVTSAAINPPPVSVGMNPQQQTMVPVTITMDSTLPPGTISVSMPPQNLPPIASLPPTSMGCLSVSSQGRMVSYPIMSHACTQIPNSTLG